MRHILSFIWLLVGGTLPTLADIGDTFTALTEEGAKLEFKIINESPKECEVIYSGSVHGAITIPSTANEYSVTAIGNAAFSQCDSLISITIPNSVTTIKSNAFNYCSSLTSITIPKSVTIIWPSAFEECI